jgi:hypothetical protein
MMNNKKGGVGAKILIVLILMIASAVGGAYAYRVLDGKIAVREAMKAVEDVDISDYDTEEQATIQGFIDEATKDIESAKTRKEVNDIVIDFIADVEKVQTSNEKKLEQALKAAEEANNRYNNSNNNTDTSTDSTLITDPSAGGTTTDDSYKSNDVTNGTDDKEDSNGFLGSLIGGMSGGASNGN